MIVAYMVITTLISFYFSRKTDSAESYYVADRKLSTGMIIAMLFSEFIAGAGTVGNAASAFNGGLSSVWANWGMAIGCFMFVPFVGRFYHAMAVSKGAMSIPECFRLFYDKRTHILLIAIIVLVYIMIYSTQAIAAASVIAPLLGVNPLLITWIVTFLFIAVTLFGGMEGIAWMNVLHSIVMYLGMFLVAFVALRSVGGMDTLRAALPEKYFSFAQPNLSTIMASALGTGLSFLAAANVTNGCFCAKSAKASNRGIILAGMLCIPFALAPAIIGICARVAVPAAGSNSVLYTMANFLGSGYGGIISTAIIAAIYSPGLLLIICTVLTKDLFKGYVAPHATEKQQLLFTKVLVVAVGVISTIVGLHADSILDQMLGAFQIRSVVGIVLAVSLFWPRVSKDAAFWSMLGGGAVAVVWQFSGRPFGISTLWPAAAVCLMILIPMTLFGKEKISPGYRMYKEALKRTREIELDAPPS
jgi:SSS family solute:Na+ symporter